MNINTLRAILKIGLDSASESIISLKKRDFPTNSYEYGWWKGRYAVCKELIELCNMSSEEKEQDG